ncbi:MAG: hypothetical protein C5B51_01640 [Terriglobia bacterium]|nr:MAG: hypothetical protein C5B51_01640 [Terriglobia bacterium]
MGVMHDDGLNADAVAGDGVYTLQVSFNESAAGQIQLQVSAAFQGMLKRVFSPLGSLMTWNRYSDSVISLIYPPGWNTSSQGKTLSLISPDRATIQASGDENDAPANFTVTLLSKPVPFDIQSFVASYNAGWFLNYPNVTSLILNGKVANVYSDTGDTANYAPVIAAFIVGDSSIALVTLNDPENDQTPTDTSVFSQVLASIAF